ncbi:hypothetical protein [Methylobacterium sp. 391_Methyba4]|uniref:hypothetical protein n=1 Tax=Methylobacterium sp. 391_Methyba4 TaxID=3038924 RepID=UPI00241E5D85|nr:hypothetical protein [Methylobacterium sp. 391_Methyba4]WFS09653.1 hypothetical protein P9K36_10360 [Methylobacterium sp. 391_Methyba4]
MRYRANQVRRPVNAISDRLDHADEINLVASDSIATMGLAKAFGFFEVADVTVGPVYDGAQVVHDPHVIVRCLDARPPRRLRRC